jgi:hypothetical protein
MAMRRPAWLAVVVAVLTSRCFAGTGEPTGRSSEAILNGSVADTAGSPVLLLKGPEGLCTSVLVAPTLVATVRHCVAQLVEGLIACTASGDLVASSTGAGELGADDAPADLSFFTAARAAAADTNGTPDAVGVQILSTGAPSVCRDDLAFVVLNQAIPGIVPVPIRLETATAAGEDVSVWGYGFTTEAQDPVVLRYRDDAVVVGVGPATPSSTTQPAPVRSLRLGPSDLTCNGDSGGPIFSNATGALIGLVSFGPQATLGPFCSDTGGADATTGPVLSDYQDFALSAFAAAGATPVEETQPASDGGAVQAEASVDASDSALDASGDGVAEGGSDAGTDGTADGGVDAFSEADSGLPPADGPEEASATGSGCEVRVEQRADSPWSPFGFVGAMSAAILARRRRS